MSSDDGEPEESSPAAPPPSVPEGHTDDGLDLARQVTSATAGSTPAARRRRSRRTPPPGEARRGRVSGAHPDDRDPQTMDATLGRFVTEQGWETELRVHGVFSRWEAIVGRDVGQHVSPESYADGRLVRFQVVAQDASGTLLATGEVRRVVVDRERFLARITPVGD